MPRLSRLAVVFSLGLLGACGGDRLAGVVPRLVPAASSVPDPTGAAELVVDFGEVAVNATASASFGLRNDGRAPLTLAALSVDLPFALDASAAAVLARGAEGVVFATFSPTVVGPAEAIVEVESDGGSLRVRLTGVGRPPGATECVYGLSATEVDFGVVAPGEPRDLAPLWRFVNKGAAPCVVRRLGLEPGSDTAFSIPGGAAAEQVVPGYADWEVPLRFEPTKTGSRFTGTLAAKVDGASDVRVAITGSSITPASAKVYVNGPTTLSSWDPSGSVTPVGTFMTPDGVTVDKMTDIAINADGILYGCSYDKKKNERKLHLIDANSATVTSSVDLKAEVQGLTFLASGELVASGDGVWVLDPSTGEKVGEDIVPSGSFRRTSGDIIALPNGSLIWTIFGESELDEDTLVRIDQPLTAPVETVIGTLPAQKVFGLGFADAVLYGFTGDGVWFKIDADNDLYGRLSTPDAVNKWWGATTNPKVW